MEKFLISCLIFAQVLFSQDVKPGTDTLKQQAQFVLPEFVITGRESLEVNLGEKLSVNLFTEPEFRSDIFNLKAIEKPEMMVNFKTMKPSYVPSREVLPSALFRAGIGRYITTYFDGVIQGNLWKNFLLGADFQHRASQGFIENADYSKNKFSVGTKFELPKLNDKILSPFSGSKVNAVFGYSAYSFGFYGSKIPSFRRSINHLSSAVLIETAYFKEFDFRLGFKYNRLDVLDTLSVYPESNFDGREDRSDFDLRLRNRLDLLWLNFDVNYSAHLESYLYLGIGAEDLLGLFDLPGSYSLDFKLKFFSFRNSGDSKSKIRFYPAFNFSYTAGRQTKIYVKFQPEVQNYSIVDYLGVNRFTIRGLKILQPENYFDLAIGVNSGFRQGNFDLNLSFRAFKNFPAFVECDTGFYEVKFIGRAQFAELTSTGFFDFGNDEIYGRLIVRSSFNSESRKQVPFYPSFEAVLTYTRKFAFGFEIDSEISLISNRTYNLAGENLKGFFVVDVGARYRVLKNLKVFARVENLLSQRYDIWHRYVEPDIVVLGGIEYRL